jgi:hypothetical protein
VRLILLCTVLAAGLLAGCTMLLPQQKTVTQESWSSFDDAKRAIERIVPYETRRAALEAASIDPYKNPAITILSYSDVVQRFAIGATIKAEELDRGIRECLTAGKACTGYQIDVRRVERRRIGNFWLDSFNFKREVDVRGWSFRALILFVDDLAVYTLYGGQPLLHEEEISRNPLGPLQSWGESMGSTILNR